MKIYFIRHGHPDYKLDCLTELGHKQAEIAAENLRDSGIEVIYSSSCGRAVETAEHTAKLLGLSVETFDFMRELGWITEIDPTPFLPLSEQQQARFDAEQNAREIEFIEWNQMYGERMKRKMTHADFITLAENRLAAAREAGNQREVGWYSNYLSIVENKLDYETELVRLTLTMSNDRK